MGTPNVNFINTEYQENSNMQCQCSIFKHAQRPTLCYQDKFNIKVISRE